MRKPDAKKEIKVHNTVNFDAGTLLPITFGSDAFINLDGVRYYPFFAPDDNLFRTLLEARLLSPTLSNCINDKTFYTKADGLNIREKTFPKAFDRRINDKRQTIDDVIGAVAESIYADGNKFIEITRTEVGGERFVFVYPHNNMDCRLEEREDGKDPTHVLRSKQFRRNGYYTWNKDDKPLRIPLWDDTPGAKCWLKKGGVERTMLHIKNEIQGVDNYGLPSFYPGLLNVLLEHRVASFNLDNFDNNMFLAGLLFIQGAMSPAEEKKFLSNLKKMYTGKGKGKRVLPISSESGLQETKFVPFNETHEGHFSEFDGRNEDKIISVSSWSKALMDMKDSSGLGKGGEFLSMLFKIKFRTVILPTQTMIMNNFVFPLMQIIDEWKSTKFYEMDWYIKPVIPVSLEGVLDINSLLTIDEGREEIGKKPLGGEKGKLLISEAGGKKKDEKGKNKKEESK